MSSNEQEDGMNTPARPTHRDDLIAILESDRCEMACMFDAAEEAQQFGSLILKNVYEGEWFDFGAIDIKALLKAVLDAKDIMKARLAIPPYDRCVFRFRMTLGDMPEDIATLFRKVEMGSREKVLLITRDSTMDAMSCVGLDVTDTGAFIEKIFVDTKEGVGLLGDGTRATLGLNDTLADQSLYMLYGALWIVLNTKNIDLRVVEPSIKLNKARVKRGKQPLKRVTYVNAAQYMAANRETESMGTRASPRMHLRRAHLRRLPNGEQIVIHAMIVNAHKGDAIERDHYRVQTRRPESLP